VIHAGVTGIADLEDRTRQWADPTRAEREVAALDDFVGWTGVLGVDFESRTDGWLHPRVRVWAAVIGDVLAARRRHLRTTLSPCTGRSWDDAAHARFISICEGIERYTSYVYDVNEFTQASAIELGSAAMSFDGMARFSLPEMARAGSSLGRPDRWAQIRWCEGVDLHTGGPVFVPAVMAYIVSERLEGETFWIPFSTGVAVHRTMEEALLGAICEVVERDAAMMSWLQRLPLPLLDDDVPPAETEELAGWFAERGVRTLLFDATTDIGIPTVWCLQLCDRSPRAAQVVGTACGPDHRTAARKAVLECVALRDIVDLMPPPPRDYSKYSGVIAGAVHMSRSARRKAFSFLLEGLSDRAVVPGRSVDGTPAQQLDHLLGVLRARGLSAYAVDLTTRETEQAGLVAVRAVLPQLLPLSVQPRAQYRATPRLYKAPALMGHPVRSESRLNPYPMPVT